MDPPAPLESILSTRSRLLPVAVLAAVFFCAGGPGGLAAERPPNIVYIMADDLGYGDLGCYGQETVETPNIDRLATEGMRFTDHYAGSTVCRPSRLVLLTGYHSGHTPINSNANYWLQPDDVTVTRLLKQAGYATGGIGKWALGIPDSTGVPHKQHFDFWFGYLDQGEAHNYYPEHLWRNGQKVPLAGNVLGDKPRVSVKRATYSHDLMTDAALEFIRDNARRPFCLQAHYTIPHANNEGGRATGDGMEVPDYGIYKDRDWPDLEKGFAAMVTRLDADVGRIVDLLAELDIDRKTLVLFTSDNGPHQEGGHKLDFFKSGGPLRGYKRDLYEGGIRVPMIAWWPGTVRPGSVSDHPSAFWDFLPTACELAGVDPPEGVDGISYLPELLGKEQPEHAYLFWKYGNKEAVRKGRWKAVRLGPKKKTELYNLDTDLAEEQDVAQEHPEIVAEMEKLMGEAQAPKSAKNEPAARPNILLSIADDASYPHMGAYGCSWVKTPGFDRVAREGILFTNAYTPNAKCAPSRSCILTGRNSWQLEAAANHIPYFPAKFKTYAETLSEHGYFVGYTAKGWAPGDAGTIDGKPRQLAGQPFSKRRAAPPAGGISPIDYAANFRDFLDARKPGQPFCFWYGCYEPHRGYEYGSGVAKGGKSLADLPAVPGFWPDNEVVRNDLLDYAFEIEHFDRHLERMLAALEEIGELDNTLVLVTADNGLPFPRCKGQGYELSNHLPLAAMWKNGIRGPGRTVDDYVNFIDFAPTFLELAGVDHAESGMEPCQGRSLTDVFFSPESGMVNPERDHVLIGKERHDIGRPHDWGYPIRGIVRGGFLYLRNFEPARWPAGNPETGYLNCDGSPTKTECLKARLRPGREKYWQWSFGKRPREELYRIAQDPECLENLAADPDHADTRRKLEAQLLAELAEQGDPRMFGRGNVFDEYEYAHEGQRGFYERFMKGEKIPTGWINPTDVEKEPLD